MVTDNDTRDAEFIASDKLIHNGVAYTGTDMVGRLCRALPKYISTLYIYRGDILCLTIKVKKRRLQSLREDKAGGFRLAEYHAFPLCVA